MKILETLKKAPVIGGFLVFLDSPTGEIFKKNLHEQKALNIFLFGLSASMATITGARAILNVAFLQVITGASLSVIPPHWFDVLKPLGLDWVDQFEYGRLIVIAVALVCLSMLNFAAEFMQRNATALLGVRFVAAQRKLITEFTMKYDASFFSQSRISEVNATFSLFTTAISNILGYAQQGLTCVLRMSMVLAVIFYLDPVLTLAICFAAGFLWPIMTRMNRKIHKIAEERRQFDIKSGGLFSDLMYGMRIIKQSNQQERFTSEFYRLTDGRDDRQVAYARASALANTITQVFGMITVMGIAFTVFALKQLNFFANIGFILGYMSGVQRFFGEVNVAVNYYTAIGQEMPHLLAMNKVLLDETILESYHFRGTRRDFDTSSIAVKNCNFSYYPGVPVLKNVTFEAKAGTVMAVLGLSGSGKSTLFELMAGYRAAPNGSILVGGVPLSDIDIKAYRSRNSYVAQGGMVFNLSVKDNIKFVKTNATDQEVIDAAKKAQAHDFILELKDGYDTSMGDRGSLVSGGQKQRIVIAQTILSDPEIMIMDEATSGLDFIAEQKIMKTLFADIRARKHILLVATHRLVTVAAADQIIFLHKGEIVERGTHDELMKKGGLYRDLYHFQTEIEGKGLTIDDFPEAA